MEYEAEFAKLAKYTPTLIADEASQARRLQEGLRANIRQAVSHFEFGSYEDILNKALVVERRLVAADEKQDAYDKKRSEPAGGFNGNGAQRKFNNQGSSGNANKESQGNKLRHSRCVLFSLSTSF